MILSCGVWENVLAVFSYGGWSMASNKTETESISTSDDHMNTKNDWQIVSLDVLKEKYAKGDEQNLDGPDMVRTIRKRVAKALAKQEKDPQKYESLFLKTLEDGFIPAGRINSAAGANIKNVTLINCFVQPVGDSISSTVDGKVGIYHALLEAAEPCAGGRRWL